MRKHPHYTTNDRIDPATTISIDAAETDDPRHKVLVERELRDRTYAVLWDTEIGEYTQTELYMIAKRTADEYRVTTRFRLVDLRVSPVAHPDPRNLASDVVPQSDVAKELRYIIHAHPGDIIVVHPGGLVIEHPDHGPYSAYIDSDGEYVQHRESHERDEVDR